MKILVAIPVYINNQIQLEFTQKTVTSIQSSGHSLDLVIFNNFCRPEFRGELASLGQVIDTNRNNLSAAWNRALDLALAQNYDFVLFPNNDLIFRHDCVDNLVEFAETHPEFMVWTAAEHTDLRTLETREILTSFDEHPHFSLFLVKPSRLNLLAQAEMGTVEPYPGRFDDHYDPAYFEDQDMVHRIYRAGFRAAKTGSAWFYHFGSRTIKTDDDLFDQNSKTFEQNRHYFIDKWGYDPNNFVPREEPDRLVVAYPKPFNS